MSQTVNVASVPTSRADYHVKVSVSYDSGSMRRQNRGYWVHVRIVKTDGPFEMQALFGHGTSMICLERVDRYAAKKLETWANAVKATIADSFDTESAVYLAIAKCLELEPTVNL